jgi:hypothetical protein
MYVLKLPTGEYKLRALVAITVAAPEQAAPRIVKSEFSTVDGLITRLELLNILALSARQLGGASSPLPLPATSPLRSDCSQRIHHTHYVQNSETAQLVRQLM